MADKSVGNMQERQQWRSQGAVAAVAPLGPDSDKKLLLYQWFILYHKHIVFLREAFFGLEYAENAFAAWASPRTPLWSLRRSPDPLVGWGGTSLLKLHPTRRKRLDPRAKPRAFGARVCSLHVIPGYASERQHMLHVLYRYSLPILTLQSFSSQHNKKSLTVKAKIHILSFSVLSVSLLTLVLFVEKQSSLPAE